MQEAEPQTKPIEGDVIKEESDELVFDETTEFVRAVAYEPVVKPDPQPQTIAIHIKTRRSPSASGDQAVTEMDIDQNGADDGSDSEMEGDEAILNALEEAIGARNSEAPAQSAVEDDGVSVKVNC